MVDAPEKPWYRQWLGAPKWFQEMIQDNPTVKDPEGREYDLEARPVGVFKLMSPYRLFPIWALAWLVHALRYRRQWEIDIRLLNPGSRMRGFEPERWIYEGYGSKAEARAVVPVLVERIEAGTWRPGDPL
jgi:hypothetical protein